MYESYGPKTRHISTSWPIRAPSVDVYICLAEFSYLLESWPKYSLYSSTLINVAEEIW